MTENTQSFSSEQEWINKASSWLTRHEKYHPSYFRALCFDSAGKICRNCGDFSSAIYPVYWVWPDQNLFTTIDNIERRKT